jgi:ATP adenylyltransferase
MDEEKQKVTQDRLWAPWRMAYIGGGDRVTGTPANELKFLPGADANCFMCRAAADMKDRENLVVARGRYTLVILNRYPYNNGHLLVAPLEHRGRLDEIAGEVNAEAIAQLTRASQVIERLMHAQGFNIGLNLGQVAGAGVPGHLHWHLVPRWQGDSNFMPVTADTRIVSQSLDAVWDLLSPALAEGQGDG